MQPIAYRFEPVYRDYLWGGGRIPSFFGRPPRDGSCAESWEISDRPEGMSVVGDGPAKGTSLHDLLAKMTTRLAGTGFRGGGFPLLVKIIDAGRPLSVQVHPDRESARLYGGQAKTEMWHVLDAGPQAFVYAGLKPGTGRPEFERALETGSVESLLRRVPVARGDAVFVPGGRVHAVGRGCLLLEIQQNSNTTYRVYDWGRTGADGYPRPLHLEQAMQVIRWDDTGRDGFTPGPAATGAANTRHGVIECDYFRTARLELAEPVQCVNDGSSFHALFVARGSLRVESGNARESAGAGTSLLLPAGVDNYRLVPGNGSATVVRISLGAAGYRS